ncbi:stimulated by retinoic acid gene 8 protein homolog [Gracilinanus agilis]|uniref:stimulated by retinoic acid gene 8 protein homolog n=1 Tax=Gracilinanus agilis TaxID=191870 RepID=UPI001CFF1B30|nr:stimulated by retinoic acid gene 8 protein homolog [Gracilinanus agilis]
METSGNYSSPYVRVAPRLLAQLQELEPRVLRRRLSQARHRATLAGLFNSLRRTVFSQSDSTASKWQVLRKAKHHIQELEQTLDNLLKMKESFNLEDGNASTLEEVREEYARMYSNNHSMTPETLAENGSEIWYLIQEFDREVVEEEEEERRGELSQSSPVTSSPDLVEFERYLYFYKQTVGLLIENGVVSPEQVTLPIVSTAISHVWQELPEDKRESILQACAQIQSDFAEAEAACAEPPSAAEDSVKDSGVGSQEAAGSLVSTPEEILFEDAFDVATSVSSPSSEFAGCSAENPEENDHLYIQIISFLKGLFYANTQLPQETIILLDDETVMLRCTETFDDEDL